MMYFIDPQLSKNKKYYLEELGRIKKQYGNDVFLIENCFQCADALSIVYDCKANIVCEFGGIDGRNTCPNFDQNKTNEKILYDN